MNWKDKLRYGMSRMLYGRYGMDELGRFLWGAVIVLLIINLFVPNLILTALTLIVLIWMYARFFSKHYDRRRAENDYKVNLKTEIMIEDLYDKVNAILAKQSALEKRLQNDGKNHTKQQENN